MEGKSIIGQIGVVFGTLLAIAVILYLAYAATKLLGKRFSVRGGGSKKIKILDSVSVGQGKTILIVQTGGKTFLIGSGQDINLISELDSNEFLCDGDVLQPQTTDFKTAFIISAEKTVTKRRMRMAAVIRNKAAKKKLLKYIICFIICLAVVIVSFSFLAASVSAESSITLDISSGEADENSSVLDILFLLAFLALIPSFLLMMTSFVRIIIALSFLRNAIGTQTSPPNQVLIGLALFLSLFIMFPVLKEIKQDAYDPYKSGEITMEEAIAEGSRPLKTFMLKQVYEADLDMFMSLADSRGIIDSSEYTSQEDLQNLSLAVVVPSFITSELKRAFLIGFLLYIPFLLIDLIVSSTLMSMGMVMLPPTTISLPFKLMLFIVVDGWNLLFESLIISFR